MSSNIDWNSVIKKEAKGNYDEDFGKNNRNNNQ
jgi:hypothetical protein